MRQSRQVKGYGGVTLAADCFGDQSKPPVIFMHGGGQTRHAWEGPAKVLAHNGFFAVTADARGHGDSGWATDGDYSIEALAADAAVLSKNFGPNPVIVGASMGGLQALLAEGENNGLVKGLVLVDVATRLEPAGIERILAFMRAHPDGFASLEEAADVIARYLPHRPRPKSLEGLAKNLRRREDGRLRWHWDPEFMNPNGRLLRPSNMPSRLDDAARNIRVPTLLVRGGKSDVLSEESARYFLELVPHAEYVDVVGAEHMVAGDKNDAFTDAVLSFLKKNP